MSAFVLYPYVSEKSSQEVSNQKFTFLVEGDVNKILVQNYFKSNYNLTPVKVNVINRPDKKIRRGRKVVTVSQKKKIVVTFNANDDVSKISEMY